MRRLSKILVSTFSLFVVSCSKLPPKPKGTVWMIDIPRSEIVGADFGRFTLNATQHGDMRGQFIGFKYDRVVIRKPLSEADKYICFDPDTWDRFDSWVRDVQKEAESRGFK